MKDSDLTGDSSLARAFESKHGHLQLRGNSRSSIEEPGILIFLHEVFKPDGVVHLCLESRPTDRSSYLYCLSNPKILIRGGVLRVGSDPIPAVKVLPDPAHLPLKLECLYRGGYPRNR
ncbi:hypothetical protein TSUD_335540 [Trifolium subterraneum]|uniref:Uncharacterized protein n=2 Tax=Trifolium TaxID=3898 RepID=A0A2Z6LMG4_TRISU|nr:hypothetical protein TSUD_335540 [Trifolium subterraneum]